jgi:hypothetical protein
MLELFTNLEDALANKKKLFSTVCQQLLCPAMQLWGLLLPDSMPADIPVSNILNGLEGIFQSLFRR